MLFRIDKLDFVNATLGADLVAYILHHLLPLGLVLLIAMLLLLIIGMELPAGAATAAVVLAGRHHAAMIAHAHSGRGARVLGLILDIDAIHDFVA